MNITQVISDLQRIKDEHGEIEVFDVNFFSSCYINVMHAKPGDYPTEWDMPEKFVMIGEAK